MLFKDPQYREMVREEAVILPSFGKYGGGLHFQVSCKDVVYGRIIGRSWIESVEGACVVLRHLPF